MVSGFFFIQGHFFHFPLLLYLACIVDLFHSQQLVYTVSSAHRKWLML